MEGRAQHDIAWRAASKLVIGNKTYVVKVGLFPMAEHLTNTHLINWLKVKDVHAPASQPLTEEFKKALQEQTPNEFGPKGKLAKLLGVSGGNAMISPAAPGSTIWKLLGRNVNDDEKRTLVEYVTTKGGAHALGALTMIDMVDGMDDRLVGSFNGGNFLFDPQKKELWCVDNVKRDDIALSTKKDDSVWKTWVTERNYMQDDKDTTVTDKGKSLPELFHWMIYERKSGSDPNLPLFVDQIKLSPKAKDDTLAGIKEAVSATYSDLKKLVDTNQTVLKQNERNRLRERLAFLEARKKFTDLLDFAKFEKPTSANSAGFVRSLQDRTTGLVDLQKGEKAWGKQLDTTITKGIQKIADDWVEALRTAGNKKAAEEVKTAAEAFLKQLNIVAG